MRRAGVEGAPGGAVGQFKGGQFLAFQCADVAGSYRAADAELVCYVGGADRFLRGPYGVENFLHGRLEADLGTGSGFDGGPAQVEEAVNRGLVRARGGLQFVAPAAVGLELEAQLVKAEGFDQLLDSSAAHG